MSASSLELGREPPRASPRALTERLGRLSVLVRPWAFEEAELETWAELEARAIVPDPGLSPFYLLPAMRCLGLPPPLVVTVEGTRLLALGLFYPRQPNRRVPFPHLEALRFSYSLRTVGWLVDRQALTAVLEALRAFLGSSPWHGIRFAARPLDGEFERALAHATRRGRFSWKEVDRCARAAVRFRREAGSGSHTAAVVDGFECVLDHAVLDGLRESGGYRRQWRRLAAGGRCRWRIVAGGEQPCAAAGERLLALEDQGWKHAQGTSLLARSAGHARFFREMLCGFAARRRVFFTELVFGNEPIATSCYLIAGTQAFHFKLGWSQAYARYSPMILNELMLLRCGAQALPGVSVVDAVNAPGDYIESLWPDRLPYASGWLLASPWAHALWPALSVLRRAARWARRLRAAAAADPA